MDVCVCVCVGGGGWHKSFLAATLMVVWALRQPVGWPILNVVDVAINFDRSFL